MDGAPVMERLFQGIENETGMGGPARPPAADATGIGVDDEGDIDEAGPGRDIGEVGEPKPVRGRGMELAVDLIERTGSGLVADRCLHRLAADRPFETHLAHQPRDGAAGDVEAFPPQLPPDLAHPIDPEVLLEHAPHFDLEFLIALRPRRQPGGIAPLGDMVVVGRRGDRQHLADRLDPMRLPVIVDERDHGLNGRSSSAWAKYADALRRISLACEAPGSPAPEPSASRQPRWEGRRARRCPPQPSSPTH